MHETNGKKNRKTFFFFNLIFGSFVVWRFFSSLFCLSSVARVFFLHRCFLFYFCFSVEHLLQFNVIATKWNEIVNISVKIKAKMRNAQNEWNSFGKWIFGQRPNIGNDATQRRSKWTFEWKLKKITTKKIAMWSTLRMKWFDDDHQVFSVYLCPLLNHSN